MPDERFECTFWLNLPDASGLCREKTYSPHLILFPFVPVKTDSVGCGFIRLTIDDSGVTQRSLFLMRG